MFFIRLLFETLVGGWVVVKEVIRVCVKCSDSRGVLGSKMDLMKPKDTSLSLMFLFQTLAGVGSL